MLQKGIAAGTTQLRTKVPLCKSDQRKVWEYLHQKGFSDEHLLDNSHWGCMPAALWSCSSATSPEAPGSPKNQASEGER